MVGFDHDRLLRGFNVGFEVSISSRISELSKQRSLSNCGRSDVDLAVKGILVREYEKANIILEHSIERLRLAMQSHEVPAGDYRKHYDEADRASHLALAVWLSTGVEESTTLEVACKEWSAYYQSKRQPDKVDVSIDSPFIYAAGAHDVLLKTYAKVIGDPKLIKASQIRTEHQMCCWLIQKVRDKCSQEDVKVASDRFLHQQVPKFVAGHFAKLAQWMKILFSADVREVEPFALVCKSLNYL